MTAIALSAIAGLAFFKQVQTAFKVVTGLLLITLCSELIGRILVQHHKANYPVFHFYAIVAFWIYSVIYFFLMPKFRIRMVFLLIPILFTGFSFLISLKYQRLDSFPSINITVSSFILIIYSLTYYKYIIDLNPFEILRAKSYFWFNSSVLAYFSIQLFIWGLFNYLIKAGYNLNPLITFGAIVSTLYYLILGYSIWLDRKNRNSDQVKSQKDEVRT
ncbi:MAG: hypothetical protein QM802_22955 [Agriterribacter sp.]